MKTDDNKLIKNKIAQNMYKYLRKILTNISPTLNTKITYYIANKKFPNLKNPTTFEEKLMWLKLNMYNDNPLVTMCADKYRVREYVINCGYSEILNDLIGVWDFVDQIDWEILPNKFVLKCNHGSGYNLICTNKEQLNVEEAKKKINKWLKEDFWKLYAELNYKNIPKKIICEKYLDTEQGLFAF